jgi:hypothetical protein
MSEDLESLRAEVAALRAEVAEQRDRSITRRRLLAGLAGLGAAGAAGVAAAPSAAAADGDPVLLGQENSSDSTTSIERGDPATYPETDAYGPPTLYLGGSDEAALVARSSGTAVNAAGFVAVEALGVARAIHGASAFIAIHGEGIHHGVGVIGSSEDGGAGVYASSGMGPALFLKPTNAPGPPLVSWDGTGALSVDPNGDLWLCVGLAEDDSESWTRLLREDTATGRVVPIEPMRALDTRATDGRPSGSPAISGQKHGPLHGGEAVTLDLAGAGAIPATASGVVGNLTVVKPDYSGYLVAVPSGSTSTSSALNFDAGEIVANAFTSALGAGGLTLRANGGSARSYHLVVDVTAYIT